MVLGDAFALVVQDAERDLGVDVPLLSGQAIPIAGFGMVLGDALAVVAHEAETELREDVALFSGSAEPLSGFDVVLSDALARVVVAEQSLGLHVSPLSRLMDLLQFRRPTVLLVRAHAATLPVQRGFLDLTTARLSSKISGVVESCVERRRRMDREEMGGGSGRQGNQPSSLPFTVEIPMRTTKLSDLPSGAYEAIEYLQRNLPRGVTGTVKFVPAKPSPGLMMLMERLEEMREAKIDRMGNASTGREAPASLMPHGSLR